MKRLLCLYISAILLLTVFTACSSGSSSAPAASSAPSYAAEAPAPSYSADSYAPPSENLESESAMPLPLLTPSTAGGKKIVYTVTLWLQTTGFDAGTRKLLNTVSDMEGYVQNAYINGRDLHNPEVERSASYTLRIPSERLADFLVEMEDNFTLSRLEQVSEDITAKHQQTDTRLADLLEQEKRLLETIEATTDAREKLSLERQLADVQASISSLDASQITMDDAVIYSTVTVQLSEVILPEVIEEIKEPFADRFSRTVSSSLNGFVAFCQGFLLLIIALIPIVIVLAIFTLIVLLVVRLVKKYNNKVKRTFTEGEKVPIDYVDYEENKKSEEDGQETH